MIEVINIWDLMTLAILGVGGYGLIAWRIRYHKRNEKNEAIRGLWER
ncbi:MAG: hypothetical protein MR210_09680 [Erysipelotrichaceae bacterium]|nr:hypothetical protein [Erysipelotrichaceae bacterium]MDY5251526.1 hypothetical protein [Erysipelotrichaceae bacterium]